MAKYQDLTPLQEAELKDQLIRFIYEERGPHYISQLQLKFGIEHYKFRKILNEMTRYINQFKVVQKAHAEIDAELSLTVEGKHKIQYESSFVEDLNQGIQVEQQVVKVETKKKRWNLAYILLGLVIGILSVYAGLNAKLYERKEFRLETKIDSLENKILTQQRQIELLNRKLETLHDTL